MCVQLILRIEKHGCIGIVNAYCLHLIHLIHLLISIFFPPYQALADKDPKHQPPPQQLMSIHGGPGSGKSEVFAAFIWYAYQLKLSHMLVVVSYTWKAALLVGHSEHNPGRSTTTAFGTGARLSKKVGDNQVVRAPGSSDKCKEFITSQVRFVLWDENSFTCLSHMHVSRCP